MIEIFFLGFGGLVVSLVIIWLFRQQDSSSNSGTSAPGVPDRKGSGVTSGAYGYDKSYTPGIRGATGPFPVGGRTERKKTETFARYDDD